MSDFEAWVADCHILGIEGDEEFSCQAAVWANSARDFRAQLDLKLKRQGFKTLWLEECLRAPEYIRRHGQQKKIGALARAVHPGHLIELSKMVALDDGTPEEPENYLIVEKIEGVEPLDQQFGVYPKKCVPDALREPLFEKLEPKEGEIEHYGGLENVPPMKTYAILDAAKIQFGNRVIEECEMPFRCLFKGAAAEELKDVAPYLIEVDPEKSFTRSLFTHNPAMPDNMSTVHLWHKEPGIYIRSRDDFDTIWKHFRKFTRVQDENGKWFLFRFWEPRVFNKIPIILEEKMGRKLFSDSMTFISCAAYDHSVSIVKRAANVDGK
jgi:hypothetical protein